MTGRNQAAVELGRLGGLKGGPARAASMAPEDRKRIAQKAANARWHNASEVPLLCPFCLSDTVRVEGGRMVAMVVCDSCNCTGPVTRSARSAVAAWNHAARVEDGGNGA